MSVFSVQGSPNVDFSEIDLTTVIPAVSTTDAGIAGLFRWGPIEQRILIDSEDYLVKRFGRPTNYNAETFFTAASVLAYGNKLQVVRAGNTSADLDSATANIGSVATNPDVKNLADFESRSSFDANTFYVAKYPGALGNSLKVSQCDSPNAYQQNVFASGATSANVTAFQVVFVVGSNTANLVTASSGDANLVMNASVQASLFHTGDIVRIGNSTIGYQDLKISSLTQSTANVLIGFERTFNLAANVTANSTTANGTTAQVDRFWEYYKSVTRAPGTSVFTTARGGAGDEMHVVVADANGQFTGIKGQVLEVFEAVSRATDAKTEDGSANYYKTVINYGSEYVYVSNDRTSLTSNTAGNVTQADTKPISYTFAGGSDGVTDEANVSIATLTAAYDLFRSSEDVDLSLLLAGKARGGSANTQLGNYLIDNIAEARRDCVVFISPDKASVVNAPGLEVTNLVTFRNALHASSYAFLDSGYKYMYDKYNDVYRYVPLNGDIAGLAIRTDTTREPWYSIAGVNRGQIKNLIKVAFNPRKGQRDVLYRSDVNSVVTFPGEGTLLWGDKTAYGKSSAFDRINVRRLFIVLEKAIATASRNMLFEFNDEFTRAQFRNMVEPYLRDVQGRRGIYDFKVVCDGTNNTAQVIDNEQFVGDIYIKPARSINFIQLNFVAVRTGVEFSEVVGKF